MKYAIVTFGCRVNQADSFQIEEQLIAAGGSASYHDADLVVGYMIGSARPISHGIVRKIARGNRRENRCD